MNNQNITSLSLFLGFPGCLSLGPDDCAGMIYLPTDNCILALYCVSSAFFVSVWFMWHTNAENWIHWVTLGLVNYDKVSHKYTKLALK